MIGSLSKISFKLLYDDWLLQTLEKVTDLVVFLSNGEEMIVFVLEKLLKFFVEITFQFEDDLLQELDLGSLSLVTVEIVWLVDHLEDVLTFQSGFQIINGSLLLHDSPVNFFHSFDIAALTFVRKSSESGLLIRVSLSSLVTELALCDGQNWLEFARITLLVEVDIVELVVLLLKLSRSCLFEDASRLRNGIVCHEARFTSDSILDVVLEAAELSFIHSFD